MTKTAMLIGIGALLLALAAACGPYRATKAIGEAEAEYQRAMMLDAMVYPATLYDCTLAGEYLQKAQEEDSYSDYEAAERFAGRALEHARRATVLLQQTDR